MVQETISIGQIIAGAMQNSFKRKKALAALHRALYLETAQNLNLIGNLNFEKQYSTNEERVSALQNSYIWLAESLTNNILYTVLVSEEHSPADFKLPQDTEESQISSDVSFYEASVFSI